MTLRMLANCLLLVLFNVVCIQANGWTYSGATGPDEWPVNYPNCGGQSQSPVDIVSSTAEVDSNLQFTFVNYDQPITGAFTFSNSGHSVMVSVPSGAGIAIMNGGLTGKYSLAQFHFHWGGQQSIGSEHSIDGQFSELEIHLLHYNSDLYPDVSSATNQPQGLAVLSVLVDAKSQIYNTPLGTLISHFIEVSHEGDAVQIPSFSISSLLPANRGFFRYSGSLTTPGCNEGVIWSIFKDHTQMSNREIEAFQTQLYSNVPGEPDVLLVNNFRPVQPLNGRTVSMSP